MSASRSTLRPVTVPSFFADSVIFWIWSRPWWADWIDSVRVSVYFAGLPSLRATRTVATSSGDRWILPPKPPPTSGAMKRTFDSGMPRTTASRKRAMCGTWVADQTTSCSPVGSTTVERGSMNAGTSRCCRNVRSTTMLSSSARAASIAASTSPPVPAAAELNTHVALTFVPSSSWTSGVPSLIASVMSRTTGRSS